MNKALAELLVNRVIKINRGGHESRTGKLLNIADDFLVMLTEDDGVVYYRYQHIKSVTENVRKGMNFELELPESFDYKFGSNFNGLLENLKYHWVNINRGGAEKIEGVLHDYNDEYVTIVLNEEIVRLSMYHIQSIGYGLKIDRPDKSDKLDKDKKAKPNAKTENGKEKDKQAAKSDAKNKKADSGEEKKNSEGNDNKAEKKDEKNKKAKNEDSKENIDKDN